MVDRGGEGSVVSKKQPPPAIAVTLPAASGAVDDPPPSPRALSALAVPHECGLPHKCGTSYIMDARELKRLLAQAGATFESHPGGRGPLTVRLGDRASRSPMHGSRKERRSGPRMNPRHYSATRITSSVHTTK